MIEGLTDILRVFFGLLLIFILPGYAFTLVIYPEKNDIRFIERIGIAFVLSLTINILLILYANKFFNIRLTDINISMILLSLTMIFIVIWRIRKYLSYKKLKNNKPQPKS